MDFSSNFHIHRTYKRPEKMQRGVRWHGCFAHRDSFHEKSDGVSFSRFIQIFWCDDSKYAVSLIRTALRKSRIYCTSQPPVNLNRQGTAWHIQLKCRNCCILCASVSESWKAGLTSAYYRAHFFVSTTKQIPTADYKWPLHIPFYWCTSSFICAAPHQNYLPAHERGYNENHTKFYFLSQQHTATILYDYADWPIVEANERTCFEFP